MCINNSEVANYKNLNQYAKKNSVVVLGSSFMHDIPMAELRQSFGILSDVYNRSLTDLTIAEALDITNNIMNEMAPKRILLQLGEVELQEENPNLEDMILGMKAIVETIKNNNKHCKIVLVSVTTTNNIKCDFYNRKLEELAGILKCQYADITCGHKKSDSQEISAFMKLKYFLTDDISDALSFAI